MTGRVFILACLATVAVGLTLAAIFKHTMY